MEWLWTIVIGGVVGWLAGIFARTSLVLGPLPNAAAGAAGALIGAYSVATMMAHAQTPPASWFIAASCAALSVALLRWLSVPAPAPVLRRRR